MYKTIKFTCETITPMFLSGADGKTPELRPPSIKGAMRFWWRALNANLVKEKNGGFDYSELKRQESVLFGGTDNAGRSKVIIAINKQDTNIITAHPTPHKERAFSKNAFAIGSRFEILISVIENNVMSVEQVKNLFIVVSLLGGLGNRSRRGFGSFKIMDIDNIKLEQSDSKEGIEKLVNKINTAYPFTNLSPDYPFVKSIEIGESASDVTKKIGQITHDIKGQYGWKYANAMGDARNRFSSPIYISVIKKTDGKLYPIITTLNTVPPNNGRYDENIQKDFKSRLL